MKVAIIGASGSLGRALAEVEASKGNALNLVATDVRDLERLRSDLGIRYGVDVTVQALDFRRLESALELKRDAERYYFPLGYSVNDDTIGWSASRATSLVVANSTHVCALISQILASSTDRKVDIVAFGSIAETRGRGRNIFYAMAKRSLTCFMESLLHGAESFRVRPFLFQIGYMRSEQNLGKKLLFPLADPDIVAKTVVRLVESSSPGIRYCPWYWRWICLVLRNLPWFIYRKLQF